MLLVEAFMVKIEKKGADKSKQNFKNQGLVSLWFAALPQEFLMRSRRNKLYWKITRTRLKKEECAGRHHHNSPGVCDGTQKQGMERI